MCIITNVKEKIPKQQSIDNEEKTRKGWMIIIIVDCPIKRMRYSLSVNQEYSYFVMRAITSKGQKDKILTFCNLSTVSTLCAYTSKPDKASVSTASRSPLKSDTKHSHNISSFASLINCTVVAK
jgi:hypothetical protein